MSSLDTFFKKHEQVTHQGDKKCQIVTFGDYYQFLCKVIFK